MAMSCSASQKAVDSHITDYHITYYYTSDSIVATSADLDFFAFAEYLTSLNVQCLKKSMLFWMRNMYMAFIFRSPHYKTIYMLDPPIEAQIRRIFMQCHCSMIQTDFHIKITMTIGYPLIVLKVTIEDTIG